MEPCTVVVASTGQSCLFSTNESWDYPDLIEAVNQAWIEMGVDLKMTGQAICEAHMDQTPEI